MPNQQRRTVIQVLGALGVVLLAGATCPAQPPAGDAAPAPSSVGTAEATQKAIQDVKAKLSALREVEYTVQVVSPAGKGKTMAFDEVVKFRRPNLVRSELLQRDSPLEDMVGQRIYRVVDGRYCYEYIMNAAGSGQKHVARLKGMDTQALAKLAADWEKPSAKRADLQAATKAGATLTDTDPMGLMAMDPFQMVGDLQLNDSAGADYVFTGKSKLGAQPVRLVVDKGTGLLKRAEWGGGLTVTVSNVRPDPGFKDEVFLFPKIDASIEVKDYTEDLVAQSKAK